MKVSKINELIKSIKIDPANLNYIAQTGEINGTLMLEIARVIIEAEANKINWHYLRQSVIDWSNNWHEISGQYPGPTVTLNHIKNEIETNEKSRDN